MRVAVISGSRADRGALDVVYQALVKEEDCWARWISVAHCQPVDADSQDQCAVRAAVASREVVEELVRYHPDWVLLYGDRYEILGAAMAAYVSGYPIAHLSGGDITEGSADDCMRHAISKLAHLHFPDNRDSERRLIQMGEDPATVHMVGSPQVDRLLRTELLSREATFEEFGYVPKHAMLVCLHPNTLGDTSREVHELCEALRALPPDIALIIVGPNSDPGNWGITEQLLDLANEGTNRLYHTVLEDRLYISLLSHCDMMVGNSSAGLHEAPTFATPAVNIGDRQKGRLKASSVIDCVPEKDDILRAIECAFVHPKSAAMEFCRNPYGDGDAAPKIVKILKSIGDPKALLRKRFYDSRQASFGK